MPCSETVQSLSKRISDRVAGLFSKTPPSLAMINPELENLRKALNEHTIDRILDGRQIIPQQKEAIDEAHLVGEGQVGKDGITSARIGNYTQAQIREKARILKNAGFTQAEIRKLMEAGVVGIRDRVTSLLGSGTRIHLPNTGKAKVDQFREALRKGTLLEDGNDSKYITYTVGDWGWGNWGEVKGRVKDVQEGRVFVENVDRVVILTRNQLKTARVSDVSKDFFERQSR